MKRNDLYGGGAVIAIALFLVGCFGGDEAGPSVNAATINAYSHMLHNRFYNAWVQPEAVGAPHGKISVPVDLQIDPHGRVLSFRLMKSSGYPAIDESIEAAGAQVRKVEPPPTASSGQLYAVRIYFELDVK